MKVSTAGELTADRVVDFRSAGVSPAVLMPNRRKNRRRDAGATRARPASFPQELTNRNEIEEDHDADSPYCSKLIAATPLVTAGSLEWAGAATAPSPQDMSQALSQSRDLLIKGGTVVDPSQKLHEVLDVAVKDGKIQQVARDISADGAQNVISAKGRIVTPGLIDVHVHIFEGIGPTGVNADQYCLGRGVTTAIDAGSAGSFAIAGFRQYVIKPSATRVFAMVDIGARGTLMGLVGNYTNLDWVNPQRTARAAEANKPDVVAIKVRLSKPMHGPNDMEVLKRALEAAQLSGLPLMVHVGDSYSRCRKFCANCGRAMC